MMKQSTNLGRLLLVSMWVMLSLIARSQTPTYEMYVTNQTQVSSKVYQFDVYLLRTGAASQLELASLQFGLGFDTMIVNGGSVSFTLVSGSSQLGANQVPTSLGVGTSSQSYTVNGVTYRFMNQATRSLPGSGNGTMISGTKTGCTSPGTRVGTYRLTNTVDFRNSSSSKHIFNVSAGSGRTNTAINAYVGGLNTLLTGTPMGYTTSGTCDQNVVFNPCNVSATAGSIVSACPGLFNGSAIITLSGVGSSSTGKYFLNGDTVGFTYSGNPFTISGLDTGSYSVSVSSGTGPCPSSVSFSVNAAVLSSEFSAASCDSYVWEGTTYTASGVYTQTFASVNNCDSVVTANITINESKTSSYDTTVCGSYTLPWDDEVLESGEYVHTYTTVDGCDSVVTVNVTVNTVPVASISTANDATELTCAVSSISATASGAGVGGSYLWSTGVTTATTSLTSAGTYTVTATTADGCSNEASVIITLGGQIPAAPGTITASVNPICGTGTSTLSVTALAGTTIAWYSVSEGGSPIKTGTATGVNTFTTPAITSTTTYYAETKNLTGGCQSDTRTAIVVVYGALPSVPSVTNATACLTNSLQLLATPSNAGTQAIDWYSAATAGTLLKRGSTTLDTTSTTTGVTKLFYAGSRNTSTGCVSSTRAVVSGTWQSIPASPTAGPVITAVNINNCGAKVYRYAAPALPTTSAATVSSVTGWEWSFVGSLSGNPFDGDTTKAVIDSGDVNSRVILVRYKNNVTASTGDSVRVAYVSGCGNSVAKSTKLTNVVTTIPAVATAPIITPVSISNCGAKVYRYIAPALPSASLSTATVATATGWEWSFVGSLSGNPFVDTTDAVVDSGDVNSRVILVRYKNNVTASTGDSVRVAYVSGCGKSVPKSTKLSNVATTLPSVPATLIITPVSINNCGAKVYRYIAPVLPSSTVATSAAATGWVWSFKGSLSGTNPFPGGDTTNAVVDSGDVNSRVIVVRFKVNTAAATGDSVLVSYTSVCGNSVAKAAKLSNVLTTLPAVPATLVITPVRINNCGAKVYRYTAPLLPAATAATATSATARGWVWSFKGSLSGTNPFPGGDTTNAVVDSGDVNSRVIVVRYKVNTASVTGDSVKVSFTSVCGNSAAKAAKLSNVLTTLPAVPATLVITPVRINNCGAKVYRYTAPVLPAATLSTATAATATGWVWSFKGSLSGNPFVDTTNAVVDSGDVNSRVIVVRYKVNTAAVTGDSVKVSFTSVCGNSAAKAAKLSNVLTTLPAAPASITIALVSDVCGARVYRYTAPALPAATLSTATAASATGYEWSFKGTLWNTAAIDSGDLNSRIIKVVYTMNSQAGSTDSVKLRYTSSCGNSLYKGAKLTNVAKVCLPTSRELPVSKAGPVVAPKVSEAMSVRVFPNPTTSNFNMQVITAENEQIGVRVMDAQGRVLRTLRVEANETVNIGSELKPGSYFIEVRQGKNVKTTRVLKF